MRTGNLLFGREFYNDEESVECPLSSKDISTARKTEEWASSRNSSLRFLGDSGEGFAGCL